MTILKYPLDLTGVSPNNLIIEEVHTLPVGVNRAFVPSYGPFYTNSLIVREAVAGTLLLPNVHYKAIQLYAEATEASGLEVCSIIVITDANVSNRVSIDYQVVGGEYSSSVYALQQMLDALSLDERPVAWGDIIGKPSEYAPTEHRHDAGDLYGFEYVVTALEEIKQAILIGDDASHDAIYGYVDQNNQNQDATIQALTANVEAHKVDYGNPHQTTAAQVGLGAVQNYGISTTLQAQAGADNASYMTPLRVKEAIDFQVGQSFTNHVNNIDNPHQTTKAQVGLSLVANFPVATDAEAAAASRTDRYVTPAGVRLAINAITAPNSYKLEGSSKAEVIAEALSGTAANATLFNNRTFAQTQQLWNTDIASSVANYLPLAQVNGGNAWANIINKVPRITGTGVMEVGKYIDFHDTNSNNDYDVRLTVTGTELLVAGKLSWTGVASGDGTGITNVNALKLGSVAAADYALKADLNAYAKTFQFTRAAEGATQVWIKIAEADTNIGSGANDLTLIVSGIENFGSTFGTSCLVRFGTRNTGANLEVVRITGRSGYAFFGYVKNATTGKTELWLRSETYRNKLTVNVLSGHNVDVAIGATTTAPTDIVIITPDKVWCESDTLPFAINCDKINNMDYTTLRATILQGTAANSTRLEGKTKAEVIAEALLGTCANSTEFAGYSFAEAKANILSGKAATAGTADNALRFESRSFAQANNEIINNAQTIFDGRYLRTTNSDFVPWSRVASDQGTWYNVINKVPYIRGDGVMEVGKYIDFHDINSTADFSVRLDGGSGNTLYVTGNVTVHNGYRYNGDGGGLWNLNAGAFGGFSVNGLKDYYADNMGRLGNWQNNIRVVGNNDIGGNLAGPNNVDVRTWYGFSVTSTLTGNEATRFSVNARNGDVRASGTAYFANIVLTSDRNLKVNAEVIPNAVEKVKGLTGYTFNWKETMVGSAGIMAQDLEKVLPNSVKDIDGTLRIELTGVVGLLVEAVKTLSARVEELEAR